ncbi:MAG: hypothetical protein ACYDH5_10420 [Acidimicrobiales bacterium]
MSEQTPAEGLEFVGDLPSARIRALVKAGDIEQAALVTGALIAEVFGLQVASVELTLDEYSLNSVSGRVRLGDGHSEFFKFHQEEGEEANVTEYYLGHLLAEAGLPVEVPIRVAGEPGRQVVLYDLRTEPRIADVCLESERAEGNGAILSPDFVTARRTLDRSTGDVLLRTLRPASPSSRASAIHQRFHRRLTDATGHFPGGRYESWYLADPEDRELLEHRFVVNGIEYRSTLRELADIAARLLDPDVLASEPVVTAHGDDHQGNIWAIARPGGIDLRLFDPAFAGSNIPALLAPVKATFHNVFAHPFWLYHPEEAAERITVEVDYGSEVVAVRDDVVLSPLRREILDSVAELVWAPLLAQLLHRGELPADWRSTVRAALWCCPLLVTNLVSRTRPESIRHLGLARVVMAGSEPVAGSDDVSRFLDSVTPK